MKIRWITGLLIVGTLGAGTTLLLRRPPKQESAPEIVRPAAAEQAVAKPTGEPERTARSTPTSLPTTAPAPEIVPQSETADIAAAPEEAPPAAKAPPRLPTPEEQRIAAQKRYWDSMRRRFEQLGIQLELEQDPARRRQLIQQMSQHVRIDTLAALDWAMGLTDQEEKRMAMEAISNNALVGIGAQLKLDESGFPSIEQTTALSAIGSTGLVEPGDYIIGMSNGDGQIVYFDGMPLTKIVQLLRGEPGTEIRLLMQRMPAHGGSQLDEFEVPIRRSMIVVQPPL